MTLSKKELEKFREILENLRGAISGTVKNVSLDIKVDDGGKSFSQHPSDQGTDDFNQKISMEVSEKNQIRRKPARPWAASKDSPSPTTSDRSLADLMRRGALAAQWYAGWCRHWAARA